MQHEPVLHAGLARELERGLVVVAEPGDRERPPRLVVDPDRLLQLPAGPAGAFGAFDPLGVEERDGADHRDRDRQVHRGDAVGDLGQVERDHRRVEHVLAGGRRTVEHAPQRPVAEPLQRERDLAQLALHVVAS